jgi:aerobic-type carbon monoxide dehydrogenase small subunit (CoxS/CutS family)
VRETIMIKLKINGQEQNWDGDPDLPLLWFLRDEVGLTGTKYGCGVALCGACTVIVDKEAVRACITSVSDAVGREVTTIEGLHRPAIIRFRRLGDNSTSRNAAIARPAKSCRRRRC